MTPKHRRQNVVDPMQKCRLSSHYYDAIANPMIKDILPIGNKLAQIMCSNFNGAIIPEVFSFHHNLKQKNWKNYTKACPLFAPLVQSVLEQPGKE